MQERIIIAKKNFSEVHAFWKCLHVWLGICGKKGMVGSSICTHPPCLDGLSDSRVIWTCIDIESKQPSAASYCLDSFLCSLKCFTFFPF
jgi:hypothetical protein